MVNQGDAVMRRAGHAGPVLRSAHRSLVAGVGERPLVAGAAAIAGGGRRLLCGRRSPTARSLEALLVTLQALADRLWDRPRHRAAARAADERVGSPAQDTLGTLALGLQTLAERVLGAARADLVRADRGRDAVRRRHGHGLVGGHRDGSRRPQHPADLCARGPHHGFGGASQVDARDPAGRRCRFW